MKKYFLLCVLCTFINPFFMFFPSLCKKNIRANVKRARFNFRFCIYQRYKNNNCSSSISKWNRYYCIFGILSAVTHQIMNKKNNGHNSFHEYNQWSINICCCNAKCFSMEFSGNRIAILYTQIWCDGNEFFILSQNNCVCCLLRCILAQLRHNNL